MIQANELRIGNLLLVYGTNGSPNKWVDMSLNANHILTCESNPELFKGIPISEDWLLKCGFSKRSGKAGSNNPPRERDWVTMELSVGGTFDIVYDFRSPWTQPGYDDGYARFLLSGGGYDESGELDLDIKYVHHVQNLYFALKMEELPIK